MTLDAPRGTLSVSVPLDIPIAELLPEFAALGVPDGRISADWSLAPAGGEPYPMAATLAECGLDEHAVLVLRPAPTRPEPTRAAGAGEDADDG